MEFGAENETERVCQHRHTKPLLISGDVDEKLTETRHLPSSKKHMKLSPTAGAGLCVSLIFVLPFQQALADAQSFSGPQFNNDKKLSEEGEKKKKAGSYVGVFGGNTQSQTAEVLVNGYPFDLIPTDGSFLMGFEVGYTWDMKRLPIETAIGFEGSFLSTEMNGKIIGDEDFVGSLLDTDVVGFHTDMNAATFLLKGQITLDLSRYRARLGRWVTGLRPYFGLGIGGAQLWFRNTETATKDPEALAAASPFNMDQFVGAQQIFGGLEYNVSEKLSVYAEYRKLSFATFSDEVSDFSTSSWVGGVRIRYDARKPKEE
jgi:opacity protein-like surface antigen